MRRAFLAIGVLLAFILPTSADHVVDRYGGWYDTSVDTAPYTLHYRFYVDPGPTGVNDFEFQSMMDDIYAIWSATETSECSRWKIVNTLLELRVDPYLTYPTGVHRSTEPFDANSLNYYTTSDAVAIGFISSTTANYQLTYSTIPICTEGQPLKFQ